MKIKVCGMKYNSNIKEVLSLHPDYMGFIFYEKSMRCVVGNSTVNLSDSWPSTTKKVGVFVNASTEKIVTKAQHYSLDIIQLHGEESPKMVDELKEKGLEVIKVFHLTKKEDLHSTFHFENCDYFLFDTPSTHHGGTGKVFNWSLLAEYDNKKPYFLSGGLGPDTVLDFEKASIPTPYALDINSCFEDRPGAKNINLLTTFIHQVNHGL